MVVVVVEFIDNPDPERIGIAKSAIINPCYIQVGDKTEITLCFQNRVNFNQPFPYIIPVAAVLRRFFPMRMLPVFVHDGGGPGKPEQVMVGNRQPDFSSPFP